MQLLKASNLNSSLFPSNISPSCHSLASSSTYHFNKHVHNPYLRSGCLSLIKRLSTSRSHSKRYGDLVMIRCAAVEHDDGFYMRRCVEIARTAVGYTSPNPMVGCVIVKDGKIVGEGFHPKPGQPHAEVFALRAAGDLAENATAYVSLEPCNHYGRTPPCTEALIKAKVKKVVVGMVDPNPIVASKGVERLRAAGIEVVVGVEEGLCKNLLEAYTYTMLAGKPFVTLRYSISINGHLSNKLGDGASEIGGYYSKLLQECDAVILSSTSLTENSLLPSSQEPGANQPLCIIMARESISAPKHTNFSCEPSSKCIIFAQDGKLVAPEIALKGIETVVVEWMNMDAILSYCKSRGFCNVLVDLRGSIEDFREVLEESSNQTQKVIVEVLPFWSENSHGNAGVSLGIAEALKVNNLLPKVCGQSILLEGYF